MWRMLKIISKFCWVQYFKRLDVGDKADSVDEETAYENRGETYEVATQAVLARQLAHDLTDSSLLVDVGLQTTLDDVNGQNGQPTYWALLKQTFNQQEIVNKIYDLITR